MERLLNVDSGLASVSRGVRRSRRLRTLAQRPKRRVDSEMRVGLTSQGRVSRRIWTNFGHHLGQFCVCVAHAGAAVPACGGPPREVRGGTTLGEPRTYRLTRLLQPRLSRGSVAVARRDRHPSDTQAPTSIARSGGRWAPHQPIFVPEAARSAGGHRLRSTPPRGPRGCLLLISIVLCGVYWRGSATSSRTPQGQSTISHR